MSFDVHDDYHFHHEIKVHNNLQYHLEMFYEAFFHMLDNKDHHLESDDDNKDSASLDIHNVDNSSYLH